jgi:hypothetical protein
MAELVAPVVHRLGRSAKRRGRALPLGAVGARQDSRILGFADRPKRRSTGAPLQLKGFEDG